MIQIILDHSEAFSQAEMAQMAVEAGCGWLILAQAPIEQLRQTAPDIVELCRESGVILTIENDIDAARELGLHGVFLSQGGNPASVRQELGADAIIGAEISSVASATALATADIDYFALAATDGAIAAEAKAAGVETHFVALCPTLADYTTAKSGGAFSGYCLNSSALGDDDPEGSLHSLFANND